MTMSSECLGMLKKWMQTRGSCQCRTAALCCGMHMEMYKVNSLATRPGALHHLLGDLSCCCTKPGHPGSKNARDKSSWHMRVFPPCGAAPFLCYSYSITGCHEGIDQCCRPLVPCCVDARSFNFELAVVLRNDRQTVAGLVS